MGTAGVGTAADHGVLAACAGAWWKVGVLGSGGCWGPSEGDDGAEEDEVEEDEGAVSAGEFPGHHGKTVVRGRT